MSERNPNGGKTGVRLFGTRTYNGREYRHDMRHDEIYTALGLDPKKHLPAEGVPPTAINGVLVYVLAADHPRRERISRRGVTFLRGKRTYAICTCGRHVEAGHLHQHVCRS